MSKPVYTAIVLAAGNGTRMRSAVRKQFMDLDGMPVVCYSLKAFEDNDFIDNIVFVVPGDYIDDAVRLCQKYNFRKVKNITEGSDERFKSVYNGLKVAPPETDYVLVHDGVRPVLTQELIDRCCRYVPLTMACILAVPVTDTIKIADPGGLTMETPDRTRMWSVQTPQAFSFQLLRDAYASLWETIELYDTITDRVTDDAVVVENMTDVRVRIIKGDPRNIKINVPSDLIAARAYLRSMREEEL